MERAPTAPTPVLRDLLGGPELPEFLANLQPAQDPGAAPAGKAVLYAVCVLGPLPQNAAFSEDPGAEGKLAWRSSLRASLFSSAAGLQAVTAHLVSHTLLACPGARRRGRRQSSPARGVPDALQESRENSPYIGQALPLGALGPFHPGGAFSSDRHAAAEQLAAWRGSAGPARPKVGCSEAIWHV